MVQVAVGRHHFRFAARGGDDAAGPCLSLDEKAHGCTWVLLSHTDQLSGCLLPLTIILDFNVATNLFWIRPPKNRIQNIKLWSLHTAVTGYLAMKRPRSFQNSIVALVLPGRRMRSAITIALLRADYMLSVLVLRTHSKKTSGGFGPLRVLCLPESCDYRRTPDSCWETEHII